VVRRKARKRLACEGSLPPRLRAASRDRRWISRTIGLRARQAIRVLSFVEAITVTGSALNADSFGSLHVKQRMVVWRD
jgi:hypothetical protein